MESRLRLHTARYPGSCGTQLQRTRWCCAGTWALLVASCVRCLFIVCLCGCRRRYRCRMASYFSPCLTRWRCVSRFSVYVSVSVSTYLLFSPYVPTDKQQLLVKLSQRWLRRALSSALGDTHSLLQEYVARFRELSYGRYVLVACLLVACLLYVLCQSAPHRCVYGCGGRVVNRSGRFVYIILPRCPLIAQCILCLQPARPGLCVRQPSVC